MTDETRDEIVRLTRKGWSAEQIVTDIRGPLYEGESQANWDNALEQVQAVIDETEAMSAEHDVPQWECVEANVPRTNPKIGRSGRQMRMKAIIGEAVRQGKTDWLAEQMVGGPVTWKQMRKWYMDLGLEW